MHFIPHSVLQLADLNLKSALIAYLTTPALSKDIACKHGFTAAVLSHWARKLGLPLRGRGRRPLIRATRQHRRILNLVRKHGMAATARRIGCSRQHVHQIVARRAPELHAVLPRSNSTRRIRRTPREFVVSFRLTMGELKALANVEGLKVRRGVSTNAKAREVILQFLATRTRRLKPVTCHLQIYSALKTAAATTRAT
jgi:hypothetical protein